MSEKSNSIRPAIARIWRGRIRRERADEYEASIICRATRSS